MECASCLRVPTLKDRKLYLRRLGPILHLTKDWKELLMWRLGVGNNRGNNSKSVDWSGLGLRTNCGELLFKQSR